jgi:hypothetical protein
MRFATVVLFCLALPAGQAEAQFGLSSDVQLSIYGGVSRDTSAGNLGQTFRPYRPILVTLRPEWTFGRVRVALGVSYGTPDIAEDGDPLALILHNTATLLELSPEVSYRLVQLPRGSTIRLHAGPLISIWNLKADEGARTRAGALLAASSEFPLTTRLHGVIRLSGAVSSRLFRQSDLPPEFELQRVRRASIGLGLRYGS